MGSFIVQGGIGMARGSFARIQHGKGLVVEVWDGELWITQERDHRDYFVKAGGAMLLTHQGDAIVYALADAQITLTAPVPAYYARRITLLAAGAERPRILYDRARDASGFFAGIGHRLARAWANASERHSVPTPAAL